MVKTEHEFRKRVISELVEEKELADEAFFHLSQEYWLKRDNRIGKIL